MADLQTSTTEQERRRTANNPDLIDPTPTSSSVGSSPVGVYDPPTDRPVRAGNSALSTIIAVIVLLVLAYFIFQWLT